MKLTKISVNKDMTEVEYGKLLADRIGKVKEADTYEVFLSGEKHVFRIYQNAAGLWDVTDRGEGLQRPTYEFARRTERLPERYLVRVSAEDNINDFLRMTDAGGRWSATEGRIGEKQGRSRRSRNIVLPKSYPDYFYDLVYNLRLQSGYEDKSECHKVAKVITGGNDGSSNIAISDPDVKDLITKLQIYAKMRLSSSYSVSYTDVTDAMLSQAKELLTKMAKCRKPETFNLSLEALMKVIPRKAEWRTEHHPERRVTVADMMAKDRDDMSMILSQERDLFDVMESQALTTKSHGKTLLETFGFEMRPATQSETEEVRKHLNPGLKGKLHRVFAVKNVATQEKYDKYVKDNGIQNEKLFWHGSKNENWLSILWKGLLLNPDAVVTGKMFGNGIYFAPDADKSWGYTSSASARWTNASAPLAYMAMFTTAYGKPYDVHSYTGNWYGFNEGRLKAEHPGCNCTHAHKGNMLRKDEVIFYNEAQVTIKYICEFYA